MDASSAAVALLLDSGADANARDDDGNTPLHRAAQSLEFAALDEQLFLIRANDFIQVSQHLLGKGSDINAKNAKGETPLDIVVGSFLGTRYTREVIEKTLPHVKFLLSAGAKYNKRLSQ